MGDEEELVDYGRILWRGRPDVRAFFSKADIVLVPLSLFWAALLVSITVTQIPRQGPSLALIPLALFALVGAYLLAGRFVVKVMAKRRTLYVLTDRYAIIERNGRRRARLLHPDDITIKRRGFSDMVTVDFDPAWRGSSPLQFDHSDYANTGMDFLIPMAMGGWRPFRFYDVDDKDGIMAALRLAGIEMEDRGAGEEIPRP